MSSEISRAIDRLCRDLDLPPPGPLDQDWEFTLPDELRTIERVRRCVDACANPEYGAPEKELLAAIVIDIANGMRWNAAREAEEAVALAVRSVRSDPHLHRQAIEYWASFDADLTDAWAVAPEFRSLWNEVFPNEAR